MEKKETIDLFALSTDGSAIGRVVNALTPGVVFVPYAIPGEQVICEVNNKSKNLKYGKIISVLKTSPDRKNPPCKYFKICGGCQLQHIDINAQRKFKMQAIQHTLEKYYGINVLGYEDCSSAIPEFNYRNRVLLHRRNNKLGFFKANSNDLLEIDHCLLLEPELNQAIQDNNYFKNQPEAVTGIILEKRFDTVLITYLDQDRKKINSTEEQTGHFSQVNNLGNQVLIKIIKKYLTVENLTEFYAGAGNFTFNLKDQIKNIIAVEADPVLVKAANQKISSEKISNIRFKLSTVEKYITHQQIEGTVLLDPPRAGALRLIEQLNPEKTKLIVYVSCNIATLGRDLKILQAKAYQIEKVYFVDMFSQTKHMECIAIIRY